ncbi:MAG: T9SS type A sorting domain-containing protein [Ignavibacteriaceae bacterium]|nr:T9SS type A sorting domain-containing protein [Ignavibacteriaceae bacterium]
MKLKHLSFLFLILVINSYAQVLTWTPYFATRNDTIEIIYDAALGNGALAGTFPVYAHTGVITNLSTSPSDWRYVKTNWGQNTPEVTMQFISGTRWRLKFHIQSYYNVPQGEQILQLAFVFRNSTGTIVGRAADGSDIFLPLAQPGLNVSLVTPAESGIVPANSTINVLALGSSQTTNLRLLLNGNQVASVNNDSLTHSFQVTTSGKTRITAIATDALNNSVADSAYVVVHSAPQVAAVPAGMKDGINYTGGTSATLVLYAPEKQHVYLLGDFNNWEIEPAHQLKKTPDNNRYWITLDNLTPQQEYRFQYLVDNSIRVGDPYSHKVLDPWNDRYIDSVRYPNLIPYPTGLTSNVVSVLQTNRPQYQWQVNNFQRPKKEDLVIYELLIRDFTVEQTYQSILDTLGYLKRLGINAIQLMPVMEFEGNNSWGYNPMFHFAVDKYYGTENDLKRFIDICHQNGIAVILDVVLNHAFGLNPYVRLYWDSANNRPAANSPYFNPVARHPYNVGYDFNHESQATKDYVDRFNRYWLQEFKVDGFRYDLSKGFTQTNSGSNVGQWSSYDQSRINLLKRMSDSIRTFDPGAFLILEHFAADDEERALSNNGFMLWGNQVSSYNEAQMGWHDGNKSNFDRISYKVRGFNAPNLVGYMESHDEERNMYNNLQYGNGSGSYSVKNLGTALNRVKMAGAFFFLVPGPKMIWQFGEMGYDYSINYPCMTEQCRLDPKPVRWDYMQDVRRENLYKAFSYLINLKKNYDAFESTDFTMDVGGVMKRIRINHASMNVTIIGNFGVTTGDINPNFQNTGWWYDYFTGDSINVSNPTANITLQAGEYRIYTTQKLPTPEPNIGTGFEKDETGVVEKYDLMQNYPNPFNPSTTISFTIDKADFVNLSVYNIAGEKVATLVNQELSVGKYNYQFDASKLPSGIYLYTLNSGGERITRKMMLMK